MKAARAIAVVVAVQLGLVAAYLVIEGWRSDPTPFAVEALDEPAPALAAERGGVAVDGLTGVHLVHFWATWCAPCEVELPGLLEAAEATGVPLVALTDEPWPLVERHFGHDVPAAIARDPGSEAAAAWRVSGLPDTFVVRDGRVVGRMGGPRDWRTPEARDFLRHLRSTR